MNYFDLFDLPTAFELDQDKLDKSLRTLQSQYHPDVIKTEQNNQPHFANQLNGEQFSALINTAYQTLKSPDSRATHLLALVGQADNVSDSIYDLDFLDLAMDFRIALDGANADKLPALSDKMSNWLQALAVQFDHAYQNKHWQIASDIAQKLAFLVKIDQDINKKISQLHTTDDDGLYV